MFRKRYSASCSTLRIACSDYVCKRKSRTRGATTLSLPCLVLLCILSQSIEDTRRRNAEETEESKGRNIFLFSIYRLCALCGLCVLCVKSVPVRFGMGSCDDVHCAEWLHASPGASGTLGAPLLRE